MVLHALLDRGHVGEILLQHRRPVLARGLLPLGVRRLTLRIQFIDRRFEIALVGIITARPRRVAQHVVDRVADLEVGEYLPRCAALRGVLGIDHRPMHPPRRIGRACRGQPVLRDFGRRRALGQFVLQPDRRLHQGPRGVGVGVFPSEHLHLGGGYARIARAEPQLGRILLLPLGRIVTNVAVRPLVATPPAKLPERHEFGMRAGHMIRLAERLQRHLPVAFEPDPLAPPTTHGLQPERIEHRRRRLKPIAQRGRLRVHRHPQPPAPRIDPHRPQPRALRRQRTLPIVLMLDIGASPRMIERPAMEPAHELPPIAPRIALPRRSIHEPPTPMRADVVECAHFGVAGAQDDDRIRADVVSDEVADGRNVLDPPGLKPYFAPQSVLLGAGVVAGKVGFGADGDGLGEVCGRLDGAGVFVHRAALINKTSANPAPFRRGN